jgi:fibronectin type 3 domain-containing protein
VSNAVTGATSYRVYYATSDTGSKSLAGTATGTTYSHTNLSANTTYYYFVTAVNSTGEGAYTEDLSVRTLLATLSAPTNVTATALATNSIQVTWGEVAGATSYRVYRATSATGTRTLINSVTTTSYTNEGLNAVTYWYFVTALNADNVEGTLSASASMIPKPTVPTGVSASSRSGDFQVAVTWSAVTGAASYRIYFATSLTGTKTLAGTSTSRTYNHNGEANTTYYYWVTTVNAAGESDYSVYTTDASALTPPAAPLNLRQTASTTSSVTIAWNAVPGATRYSVAGNAEWTGTDTTIPITGCSPRSDYWFVVYAYNSAGMYGPPAEIVASTR